MDPFSNLIALTFSRATTDVKVWNSEKTLEIDDGEVPCGFFMKVFSTYGDPSDVTAIGIKDMYKQIAAFFQTHGPSTTQRLMTATHRID